MTLAAFFVLMLTLPAPNAAAAAGILRKVSSSSCRAVRVNVGLDMTTQIVFEQEPKASLYADKKHFKIVTNGLSPRSLAIIPTVEGTELDMFRDARGQLPGAGSLAAAMDRNFNTNLFVFFDHGNQLTFQLHFVEKSKADNIVKVTQAFSEDCPI